MRRWQLPHIQVQTIMTKVCGTIHLEHAPIHTGSNPQVQPTVTMSFHMVVIFTNPYESCLCQAMTSPFKNGTRICLSSQLQLYAVLHAADRRISSEDEMWCTLHYTSTQDPSPLSWRRPTWLGTDSIEVHSRNVGKYILYMHHFDWPWP